jgi:hypothetical protein
VDGIQVERFEERVATQEKRRNDMQLQLQPASDEFLQVISRRCEMVEKL